MAKDDPYHELRPLMFSIAYRMLGSVSEAEDIVQEAFLRLHVSSSDGAEIRSPKALDIGDCVQTVRAISNPEKIRHLGAVSDVLTRPHG